MTTIERVRRVFQENFGEDRLARFGDDAVPFTDYPTAAPGADLDSLDHVEFIMALEDEFRIRMNDDAAEKVTSVATAAGMVEQLATETVDG